MKSRLKFAFSIWKGNRDRIIGFNARSHKTGWDGKDYYSFDVTNEFSVMIGAAFFISKDYYEIYASDTPMMKQVRDYVVGKSCCDDIAMNFIASSYSKKGPIWVRVPVSTLHTKTKGGWKGKSVSYGWIRKRSKAIQDYSEIFGENKLVKSDFVVSRLTYESKSIFSNFAYLKDYWFFYFHDWVLWFALLFHII